MNVEPAAHLQKPLGAGLGEGSVRLRSHVQQQVAALGDDINQLAQQVVGGFPFGVRLFEPPRVIDRPAGFPVVPQGSARRFLFRGPEVPLEFFSLGNPVVDDDRGFETANVGIQVGPVLKRPPLDPVSVKPEDIGVIFLDEFTDLVFHVGHVALLGLGIMPLDRRVPLENRIIGAKPHPVFFAGPAELGQGIHVDAGVVFDVVLRVGAVPQAEPVMMLGGDHEILHPGIAGGADPGIGIKLVGGKLRGDLTVVLFGYFCPLLDPLRVKRYSFSLPFAGQDRIRAPVDKHPVPGLVKPRHPLLEIRVTLGQRVQQVRTTLYRDRCHCRNQAAKSHQHSMFDCHS